MPESDSGKSADSPHHAPHHIRRGHIRLAPFPVNLRYFRTIDKPCPVGLQRTNTRIAHSGSMYRLKPRHEAY